jgi:hypothetical protein
MKTPRMLFRGQSFYIPQANNHASFRSANMESWTRLTRGLAGAASPAGSHHVKISQTPDEAMIDLTAVSEEQRSMR